MHIMFTTTCIFSLPWTFETRTNERRKRPSEWTNECILIFGIGSRRSRTGNCVCECDMIKWQLNITCGTIISKVSCIQANTTQTFIGDDAHSRENFTEPLKKLWAKVWRTRYFTIILCNFQYTFPLIRHERSAYFCAFSFIIPIWEKSKRNFHGKWKSLLWVPALQYWSTLTHRALCWVDSDFHTWCIMNFYQDEAEKQRKKREG